MYLSLSGSITKAQYTPPRWHPLIIFKCAHFSLFTTTLGDSWSTYIQVVAETNARCGCFAVKGETLNASGYIFAFTWDAIKRGALLIGLNRSFGEESSLIEAPSRLAVFNM
jgi:hypothetical protein